VCKKEKGHWLCQTCFFKQIARPTGNVCPTCNVGLSVSSAGYYDLTKFFHNLKAGCKFVDKGCKMSIVVSELAKHERTCKFAPSLLCPCNNIKDMQSCDFTGDFESIFTHMERDHKFNIPPKIIECENNSVTIHIPIVGDWLFKFIKMKDGRIYCFFSAYNVGDRFLRCTLWSFEDRNKYTVKNKTRLYHITFKNTETKEELKITRPYEHIRSGSCSWIPIHIKTLKPFKITEDNVWEVEIEIIDKGAPRKNKKRKVKKV